MKKSFNRSLVQYLAAGAAVLMISLGISTNVKAGEHKDIVDTAVEAGSFQTLAKALDAAGLVKTLKGEGPFTVFAPTDAAFAKLPEGTVEDLLKPENKDKLVAILTYHVVPGKRWPQCGGHELRQDRTGQSLTITKDDDGVMVDDARVEQTNIHVATA